MGEPKILPARDMRNYIFHLPKMELGDTELQDILDTCVAVLKDPVSLLHDKEAVSAVKKLEALNNNQQKVTNEEEIKILYQREKALKQLIEEETIKSMKTIEDARAEAVGSVDAKFQQAEGVLSKLKEDTVYKVRETGSGVLESIDDRKRKAVDDLNKLTEEAVKKACKAVNSNDRGCMTDTEQEPLNTKLPAIQRQLANHLWKHYTTTSLSPLKTRENDVRIDEVYTEPEMEIETKIEERDNDKRNNRIMLESYREIFKTTGIRLKRIYLLGDVGTGKTTFCQMLIHQWCKFILEDSQENSELMQTMKQYDFVFYLPLKLLQQRDNLREMIKWYYKNEVPEEIVDYILSKSPEKCLILADGLDEWKPSCSERRLVHVTDGIPDAEDMKDVTLVTTSRPSAPGVLNIKSTEYDRKIILSGIKEVHTMAQKYCAKMSASRQEEVLKRLQDLQVRDIERMPLLLKQIVWMLGEGFEIAPGISGLYSDCVRIAMKWYYDKYKQEVERTNTFELNRSKFSKLKLPEQLSNVPQELHTIVFSLSQIAFEMLIMDSNQIIGRRKLRKYGVYDYQIKCLLGVGLLSEENLKNPMEEDTQFCFPHTSFVEYFSAVFIASHVQSDQTFTRGAKCQPDSTDPLQRLFKKCPTIEDVLPLLNVLKFVCGLAPSLTLCVCQNVYNVAQSDECYFRDRMTALTDINYMHFPVFSEFPGRIFRKAAGLQLLVADCVTECKILDPLVQLQIPIVDLIVDNDSFLNIFQHVEGQSVQHLYVPFFTFSERLHSVECSQFKHLKSVVYVGYGFLDFASMALEGQPVVLQNLQISRLENLSMSRNIFPEILTGTLSKNLQTITIFEIWQRLHREVTGLLNLISHSTTLCSIKIHKFFCLECGEDCYQVMDLSQHDKLQTLRLENTLKIHINGINTFSLEHVRFQWCCAEHVRKLIGTQKLECLFINPCSLSTGSRDFTKEMNEDICTCTQLQNLEVADLHIQDDALQLHSGMENLSSIELKWISMGESTFNKFVESLLTLRQSVEVTVEMKDNSLLERCIFEGLHKSPLLQFRYFGSSHSENFPGLPDSCTKVCFEKTEITG